MCTLKEEDNFWLNVFVRVADQPTQAQSESRITAGQKAVVIHVNPKTSCMQGVVLSIFTT